MKKVLLIGALLSVATALGVVWEEDPSITPEERQQRREHNKSMAQKNREIKAEKEKQLEALSKKYKDIVENVKTRHKENPYFQEALAMAELETIARYDPEVQKYLDEVNAVRKKYQALEG